jgi:hypothetical protein
MCPQCKCRVRGRLVGTNLQGLVNARKLAEHEQRVGGFEMLGKWVPHMPYICMSVSTSPHRDRLMRSC